MEHITALLVTVGVITLLVGAVAFLVIHWDTNSTVNRILTMLEEKKKEGK